METIKFKVSSTPTINFKYAKGTAVPVNNQITRLTLQEYKIVSGDISAEDMFYLITDYKTDSDGTPYPGLAVGDGSAYIGDLPVITGLTADEQLALDNIININDKVGCMADDETETLIFYK